MLHYLILFSYSHSIVEFHYYCLMNCVFLSKLLYFQLVVEESISNFVFNKSFYLILLDFKHCFVLFFRVLHVLILQNVMMMTYPLHRTLGFEYKSGTLLKIQIDCEIYKCGIWLHY